MMKRHMNVLVTLDPTAEQGEAALGPAAAAAANGGGRLTLLINLEGPSALALHEYAEAEGISVAEAGAVYLDQVAGRIHPPVAEIEKIAITGADLAEGIIQYASQRDVSTVVVPSRGSEDRRLVDMVTTYTGLPVVVVPSVIR